MQLLFTESYEFGFHKGLGLIEGQVVKISNDKKSQIKIPHMGWNEIYPSNNMNPESKPHRKIFLKDMSVSLSIGIHDFEKLKKQNES